MEGALSFAGTLLLGYVLARRLGTRDLHRAELAFLAPVLGPGITSYAMFALGVLGVEFTLPRLLALQIAAASACWIGRPCTDAHDPRPAITWPGWPCGPIGVVLFLLAASALTPLVYSVYYLPPGHSIDTTAVEGRIDALASERTLRLEGYREGWLHGLQGTNHTPGAVLQMAYLEMAGLPRGRLLLGVHFLALLGFLGVRTAARTGFLVAAVVVALLATTPTLFIMAAGGLENLIAMVPYVIGVVLLLEALPSTGREPAPRGPNGLVLAWLFLSLAAWGRLENILLLAAPAALTVLDPLPGRSRRPVGPCLAAALPTLAWLLFRYLWIVPSDGYRYDLAIFGCYLAGVATFHVLAGFPSVRGFLARRFGAVHVVGLVAVVGVLATALGRGRVAYLVLREQAFLFLQTPAWSGLALLGFVFFLLSLRRHLTRRWRAYVLLLSLGYLIPLGATFSVGLLDHQLGFTAWVIEGHGTNRMIALTMVLLVHVLAREWRDLGHPHSRA